MKKKELSISINQSDFNKLNKYGFDFERNINEYVHEIAEQLRQQEKAQRRSKKDIFLSANAVYTGGNIWLFYGQLKTEEYFLTDDYGDTLILNESPANFDESLYTDWQEAHKIKELFDDERISFCDSLADRLLQHDSNDDLGGICDDEIKAYKKYWPLPM